MEIDPHLAAFAIPGVLDFHQTPSGLAYAEIRTPAATATVYLQGAHLTAWQPTGHEPVLFLSSQTELMPGKAIRGGVPVCFPWFAIDKKLDRLHGKPGPAHGFARTQPWTLVFAALAGDDLHLTFTLGPTAISREVGFDHFRVALELTIGSTLTLRLIVANEASEPLLFEEALHTYFAVADVRRVTVTGLEETAFIDKSDGSAHKPAEGTPLTFARLTDRLYDHTQATCVLHDAAGQRRIVIAKSNSDTTVVFNPQKAMADLPEAEWPHMLCIETVNASASPVTLAPGQTHTMQAFITVEPEQDA